MRLSQFLIRSLLLAAPLLNLTGCTSAPPFDAKALALEWVGFMQADYVLSPDDKLIISLHPKDELRPLPQNITIPPTGMVNLARIPHEIRALGKTVRTFRREVQLAYGAIFQDEVEIQVSLVSTAVSSIFVTGEVNAPGAVNYTKGMTITQAVANAGGFLITAKPSDVRLIRNAPGEKPRTYRVNMDDIMFDSYPDFMLLPGDVIYCQTSAIADAGNWVELYIRRLLPIGAENAAIGVAQ